MTVYVQKPITHHNHTSYLIYEVDEESGAQTLLAEVFEPKEVFEYIEYLRRTRDMREQLDYLELECGCRINAQYLPLNGGERKTTCEHDVEWVISGVREIRTTFKARTLDPKMRWPGKKEEIYGD